MMGLSAKYWEATNKWFTLGVQQTPKWPLTCVTSTWGLTALLGLSWFTPLVSKHCRSEGLGSPWFTLGSP